MMMAAMMMMVASPGANKPRAGHAPINNADGQNFEAFDSNGFLNDGTVGGAYARNRFPMPSSNGDIHYIQSSKGHDDVPSSNDRSNSNVCNGNDDDHNDNVQNENGQEAHNNAVVGGNVKAAPQGL